MARKAKGSIWRTEDGLLYARITVKDAYGKSKRPWIPLDPSLSDEKARQLALDMTRKAKTMIKVAPGSRLPELSDGISCDDYAQKLWFPSRLGKVKSIRTDRYRWRLHLAPLIGKKRLVDVTKEDLRDLVQHLDAKAEDETVRFGAKTAVCCWSVVSKMFHDAIESKKKELRLLTVNPADGIMPPDGPGDQEMQWLYPSELQQLLACDDVPLERRQLYAGTVYCYTRPSEALALLWRQSIDVKHGMVRVYRAFDHIEGVFNEYTKSGTSRHFAMEPVLKPMFEAMWRRPRADELVFPTLGHLAENLRADLLKAGVDRQALHVKRKGARMLRFHDLRATGITYMAMRGDTDNQIRERAGHTDFKTTQIYIRRGHLAAGAALGDPFGPLPASLCGFVQESSSGNSGGGAVNDDSVNTAENKASGGAVATAKEFESLLPLYDSSGENGASAPLIDDSLDDSDRDPQGVRAVNRLRVRRLTHLANLDEQACAALALASGIDAAYDGDEAGMLVALATAGVALGLLMGPAKAKSDPPASSKRGARG